MMPEPGALPKSWAVPALHANLGVSDERF
jgi:hypothetical protein